MMITCGECFISRPVDLMEYHRIEEHNAPRPEAYKPPISTGHVYHEEIVHIGAVGDTYGN
jgi:hypothetical protein